MPEIKVFSLNIPYEKQKRMAVWSRKMAHDIAQKIRPLIGKEVYLYGGGGFMGEGYIAKLTKVGIKKVIYYGKGNIPNIPYTKPDDYCVNVRLVGKGLPGQKGFFEPHIGSWKIGKIIK